MKKYKALRRDFDGWEVTGRYENRKGIDVIVDDHNRVFHINVSTLEEL